MTRGSRPERRICALCGMVYVVIVPAGVKPHANDNLGGVCPMLPKPPVAPYDTGIGPGGQVTNPRSLTGPRPSPETFPAGSSQHIRGRSRTFSGTATSSRRHHRSRRNEDEDWTEPVAVWWELRRHNPGVRTRRGGRVRFRVA